MRVGWHHDSDTAHNQRSHAVPANRADVLIKITTPGTYEIRKGVFDPGGSAVPAAVLGFIEVVGEPFDMPLPPGPLPVPAPLPDIAAGEITESRPLVYAVGGVGPVIGGGNGPNFTINGVRFSPVVINEIINLGR